MLEFRVLIFFGGFPRFFLVWSACCFLALEKGRGASSSKHVAYELNYCFVVGGRCCTAVVWLSSSVSFCWGGSSNRNDMGVDRVRE